MELVAATNLQHNKEQSALHTRCTLPTRRTVDDDVRTVLAAALLPHNPCISPAGASLENTREDERRRRARHHFPEAENALLPESAYFVGLGFRAWLGDEQTPIFVGRDPRASSDSKSERRSAAARLL